MLSRNTQHALHECLQMTLCLLSAGTYKSEKDAVKDPRRRTAQEKEKIQQQVGMYVHVYVVVRTFFMLLLKKQDVTLMLLLLLMLSMQFSTLIFFSLFCSI